MLLSRSTLKWIPSEFFPQTKVFVPEVEFDDYSRRMENVQYPVEVIPTKSDNIALRRLEIGQWAKSHGWKKFAMLDDDISQFSTRILDYDSPLRRSAPSDVVEMFVYVARYLDWYVHCGPSQRLFNSNFIAAKPVVVENTRMLRFLAYQTDLFLTCTHGRISTCEDLDITIQLLLRGYKNCVLCEWAHDQTATGTEGGCSAYRTIEVHNQNIHKLHEMYPGITEVREKRNISEAALKAGMASRLEITVDWVVAYQWGLEHGDPYLKEVAAA